MLHSILKGVPWDVELCLERSGKLRATTRASSMGPLTPVRRTWHRGTCAAPAFRSRRKCREAAISARPFSRRPRRQA